MRISGNIIRWFARWNRIPHLMGILLMAVPLIIVSCGEDPSEPDAISLISVTNNGSGLAEGTANIQINGQFELVFDAALNPTDFEQQFSLSSNFGLTDYSVAYENASSRVIINTIVPLEFNTAYTIAIETGAIGLRGQRLSSAYALSFTTMESEIITGVPPCTSASPDCLQQTYIEVGPDSGGSFSFYSNYPIYNPMARWEKLKNAVIVVHGINRNANDYFSYLTTTLQNTDLSKSTVLISPFFKNSTEAGDEELFWNNGWREGDVSKNTAMSVSSFAVMDKILSRLANRNYFPALEKVVITGHSSGALFTHLYAAANRSASQYANLDFSYVVANSQYFYYPVDLRYNENTMEFYNPEGCAVFNQWPLGFINPPSYLDEVSLNTFNDQFISRNVIYLLGNGTAADGSLNTSDCEATLLGTTRYSRGENIFRLLETNYAAGHKHEKFIVEGIGHDGQGMYQSKEFKDLLADLLF